MAKVKFQLVKERLVGRLPKRIAAQWTELAKRQEAVAKEQQSLQEDMTALQETLDSRLPPEFQTDAHEGFRLEPDGRFFQLLCECVECQAQLQGMSASAAAERMIESKLVPRERIASVRAQAYSVDAAKLREGLNRELIN